MAMRKGRRAPKRGYRRRGIRRYRRAQNIPRQPRFRGQGYLNLVRNMKTIFLQNSNTIGTPLLTDPNNCMTLGTLAPNPNGSNWDIPFSIQFSLSMLQNFTEITNLCDAYKIKYVKVRVFYSQGVTGANSLGNPTIKWVTDHDDATPPSIGDMNEKMGVKELGFYDDRPIFMGVVPRVAMPVYRDVPLPVGYIVPKSQWINSTYTNVPHYSIKGVFQDVNLLAGGGGTNIQFRIDCSVYVTAKDFQ